MANLNTEGAIVDISNLTDDELLELIELVAANSNKNLRWEQFAGTSANRKLGLSKSQFLNPNGLERRVRDHSLNQYIDKDTSLASFREYIEKETVDAGYSTTQVEGRVGESDESYTFPILFKIIAIAVCLVPAFGAYTYLSTREPVKIGSTSGGMSELQRCIENQRSSLSRSCDSDPVFTYCGVAHENIIGSGCTSTVKNRGGRVEQAAFCKKEVLPLVRNICVEELYGCAVATGNMDC